MKALFGGTFNPVHNGHIALAREVAETFALASVDFVPSLQPVHRAQPDVSAAQRVEMIRLAIAGHPNLAVNTIELERGGPSFTVDTLEALKSTAPNSRLCWLMGSDAFNDFASWKQPQRILELANLIVCARPQSELRPGRFASCLLPPGGSLAAYPAGRIAYFAMRANPCSSTAVRRSLRHGHSLEGCLAPAVLNFIHQNHLYEN